MAEQITGHGLLSKAERHLLGSSAAKRVRPRFLFACGRLLDLPETTLWDAACAVELTHTASLIHDDIVDRTLQRRTLLSVNVAFGYGGAVLAGDKLLTRALVLLTGTPRPADAVRVAAKAVAAMSDATAREVELRGSTSTTYDEVISVTDGKTGALFSLCGSLAGLAANNDAAIERLGSAGGLLGRVFQINDDIDDMEEDAKDGIPTLPQVVGIEEARNEANRSFNEALSVLEPYSHHQAYPSLITDVRKLARMELVS